MNFQEFINNDFIGQKAVIKQLDILGEEIKQGKNLNIILAARSGYGKTTLSYAFVKWLDPNYLKTSIVYGGHFENLIGDRRFQILDEAHLIENPEFLYAHMDSGKYTFIILTNEYYDLKEPFYNRCHEFIFADYTDSDMIAICEKTLKTHKTTIPRYGIEFIAKHVGRGVPRRLIRLTERLCYYFKQTGVPITRQQFIQEVENFLSIRKGFTEFDISYLEFLNENDGKASLNLITNSTRIPKKVILEEVEPYLVKQGLIRITSKGRQLV